VNITVDTNVLVRALVQDDVVQGQAAAQALREATQIAVPLVVLCELVWVLRRVYGFSNADIAEAIGSLVKTGKIALNRPAVDAGLTVLMAGGDFADGVIAFEGRVLGGETFVSFDRVAVGLLGDQELAVRLL
jgi:predicted nucleic-acid-binding protein